MVLVEYGVVLVEYESYTTCSLRSPVVYLALVDGVYEMMEGIYGIGGGSIWLI